MYIRSHCSANYSDYKFETSRQQILDSLPEGKSYKEFKNESRTTGTRTGAKADCNNSTLRTAISAQQQSGNES